MGHRSARLLANLSIVAVVAAYGQVHARVLAEEPYTLTGTFRFAWLVAFVVVLIIATYAVGLPELPRTRLQARRAAPGAAGSVTMLTGGRRSPARPRARPATR